MRIFNILLLVGIMVQCSQIKSVNEVYNDPNAIILANGHGPEQWKMDAFTTNDISITGDTLNINLSYSGGCRKHEFKLVAWNYFFESNPVQAAILLSHNNHLDPCERYVTDDLSFSLVPLKNEFLQQYGSGSGSILLTLTDKTKTPSIKYQF